MFLVFSFFGFLGRGSASFYCFAGVLFFYLLVAITTDLSSLLSAFFLQLREFPFQRACFSISVCFILVCWFFPFVFSIFFIVFPFCQLFFFNNPSIAFCVHWDDFVIVFKALIHTKKKSNYAQKICFHYSSILFAEF